MTFINSTRVQEVPSQFINRIMQGDCIEVMRRLPDASVDFILTDPPYLVNFCDRSGRTLQNDDNDSWLTPAFAEAYRVLRQDRLMLSFYGWTQVHKFMAAWNNAGFRVVGHLVFIKRYASKKRFVQYQHEQAYLLAKGRPPLPEHAISDVRTFEYTGNSLHSTQKPVTALAPVIRAFSLPGDVILDPFCGSGSTCAAALLTGRRYLGIELDSQYALTAQRRIERIQQRIEAKQSPPRLESPQGFHRLSTREGGAAAPPD
jgi:adenine-specific DNA-methyltransferase